MVDAKSQHLLWTALRWSAAALNQIDRVRAGFEPYQTSIRGRIDVGIMRVTPEMERPSAIFWSDVHFLMIAVKHLDGVLKLMGAGAPRLNKDLKTKAVELRRLLEHWWESDQGTGAWKGYRDKHGQHAGPAWVQFEPGDLRIGADPLSVSELAADVRRVEGELIEIEART